MQPSRGAENPSSGVPTVMLVDDHPLWRETLRKVIERQGAGQVIAEADDGESAVEAITGAAPDVVVMDVDLPGIDGVAATRRIVAELPTVRVLFLSSFDDRAKVVGAVEAGASGYLLKTAGAPEVADAIRRVAAGELVFPPHLAEVLLSQIRGPGSAPSDSRAASDSEGVASGTFSRSGEFWKLDFEGRTAHVADLKGLADLAELLAAPGREVLAAELVAARAGHRPEVTSAAAAQEGLQAQAGTGTGPALDGAAKRAYRDRMEALQDDIEEAEEFGDQERAARAREELQLLTEQLAGAVGLGGRDRPVSSDVERARISVTRGIRRAVRRIEEVHPELGRHLDRSVRTGTFCCYDPEVPVDWELS
ncbi:MAG: response regulator transcription factor [Actinobacteria bacterium]|nr:response regulator transcription factor [Actinomycetota bacterium]